MESVEKGATPRKERHKMVAEMPVSDIIADLETLAVNDLPEEAYRYVTREPLTVPILKRIGNLKYEISIMPRPGGLIEIATGKECTTGIYTSEMEPNTIQIHSHPDIGNFMIPSFQDYDIATLTKNVRNFDEIKHYIIHKNGITIYQGAIQGESEYNRYFDLFEEFLLKKGIYSGLSGQPELREKIGAEGLRNYFKLSDDASEQDRLENELNSSFIKEAYGGHEIVSWDSPQIEELIQKINAHLKIS